MKSFNELLEQVLARELAGFNNLLSCERLSGGASQETYRLTVVIDAGTNHLCLRRAPGGIKVDPEAGYPGLATEALLMQAAREAGVPEPQVHYVLQESDGLGEGFIMEWLEGEALGARIVRSNDLDTIRPELAYLCGESLGRIHRIDLQATGLGSRLRRSTPAEFVEQTWERYRTFDTWQPMIDYTGRWLQDNLPPELPPVLVHSDFRNGNLLISPKGIIAVLDWELAHIGDPMRDLGWICTNSWRFGKTELPVGGFGRYADLFAGYESVTGVPVNREHVKFWEVFGSFWWAVGCLGMAEHYRSGPDQTVEKPAIGRRSSECQVDCVNLLIPGPVTLVEPAVEALADMPRTDELIASVARFLRDEVMGETEGRLNFLARVAGNSLDIVAREISLIGVLQPMEQQRLEAMLDESGSLNGLRKALVTRLRSGDIDLQDDVLVTHLRQTVVNQIAIDQPKYSGLKTALAYDGEL